MFPFSTIIQNTIKHMYCVHIFIHIICVPVEQNPENGQTRLIFGRAGKRNPGTGTHSAQSVQSSRCPTNTFTSSLYIDSFSLHCLTPTMANVYIAFMKSEQFNGRQQ